MPELAVGGAVKPPDVTDPLASRFDPTPDTPSVIGPPGPRPAGGGFGTTPQGQLIQTKESGGRNIPNYRFDPTHTAGGFYQITDTNWRHYAPLLGIDINQYPNAMSAPEAVQGQVAGRMYAESGMMPWSRAAGGAIDTDPGAALAERVRQGYITQAGGLDKIAQQAISRLGSMDADLSESMKRVREALDKTEQAQETALKASQQPPKQPEVDAMQKMGGLATVVGILGGLLTRAPMRASINAGAAAIEAYNRQDLESYKIAYGNWKTQTDMLFKLAQMNADHARDILANEKLGADERRTMLDVFLRAAGLGQLADAARTDSAKVVLDWYEKNQAAQRQYELHKDQLDATAKYREAQLDKPIIVQKPDEKGNQVQYLFYPNSRRLEPLPEGTTKVSGRQQSGGPLSDSAVEYYASIFRASGYLPPGIARSSAAIAQIMNKTGAVGTPGEFVANMATKKADMSSLQNMTKLADAATSYENTAIRNFDQALRYADQAIATDWGPFLNRWVMEGQTMLGDKNVPPYVVALLTAANEYAKVMTGSTGAAAATEGARREAAAFFSPYLAKGQIREVVKVAKQEMENRRQELYSQVDDIKARLRESGSQGPTPRGHVPSESGDDPAHPDVTQNGWLYKWRNGKYEPAEQVR